MMRRGYSLIELVVVVAIMLILTASVLVGYSDYTQRQQVKQARANLQTAVNLARTKALSGEKPESCASLTGYDVIWNSATYTYRVDMVCSDGSTSTTFSQKISNRFVISGMDTSIRYLPLHQGTTLAADRTVTITLDSISASFTVTRSGAITGSI